MMDKKNTRGHNGNKMVLAQKVQYATFFLRN